MAECVAKKDIPEVCQWTISNALSVASKIGTHQFDFTKDRKKITIRFDQYTFGSFEKAEKPSLEKKIVEVFPSLKQNYIRNGYSELLGKSDPYYYLAPSEGRRKEKGNNLRSAVREVVDDLVMEDFGKRVKQEFKGRVKFELKEKFWTITYFTDAIEYMRKFLKDEIVS